jgi:UDP:flavonoid glycosyltransferase YjiC (YdhE family)
VISACWQRGRANKPYEAVRWAALDRLQTSGVAHFAFITWDGGGNVSVAMGIASELLRRGHRVTMLGPDSLRPSITGAGLGYSELGISPPADPALRSAYLVDIVGSTFLSDQLPSAVADVQPDALIIDCNLSWALDGQHSIPVAVLVHTALGIYLPVWQLVIDAANERRQTMGLSPFSDAATAWSSHEVLLVSSLAHFDRAPTPLLSNPTYVGLVSGPRQPSRIPTSEVGVTGLPLVLVSYSTDPLQNSPARVQAALDALAPLSVRVLATTSRTFDPARLSIPANAAVVEDLPHAEVMSSADVVVAHAGHGTTLAALCHGVPLVCVPGLGRDQVPIARRVAELGLGIALIERADPADIQDAVRAILNSPSFHARAAEFKSHCPNAPAAATAADVLETMLAG